MNINIEGNILNSNKNSNIEEEDDLEIEKPQLNVDEVVNKFNSWSLKGQLVNNGR